MLTLLVALTVAQSRYDASRGSLERERLSLAKKPRGAELRAHARAVLLKWVDEIAFPAWQGTTWAYEGMSTTPGAGQIACGYYVSTVLLHAGVRLQRVRLSQQSARHITESVAAGSPVETYDQREEVIARARARGEGLYVVGLDNHVGFLRVAGARDDFCHSSYLEPVAVLCEPALESPAFSSTRFVLGDALSDGLIDGWLDGRALKTITRDPRPGVPP